jgi:hypothetical protein
MAWNRGRSQRGAGRRKATDDIRAYITTGNRFLLHEDGTNPVSFQRDVVQVVEVFVRCQQPGSCDRGRGRDPNAILAHRHHMPSAKIICFGVGRYDARERERNNCETGYCCLISPSQLNSSSACSGATPRPAATVRRHISVSGVSVNTIRSPFLQVCPIGTIRIGTIRAISC